METPLKTADGKTRVVASIAIGLLLALAIAAWGWRAWSRQQDLLLTLAAVPQIPESRQLPEPFFARARKLTAEISSGRQPVPVLGALARLYHANGFAAEAAQIYRALIEREPDEPTWSYLLADVEQQEGRGEEALTLLERTVELAPDYAPAHLQLGDLLLKLGRLTEASAHYAARLQVYPRDPYAKLGLARVKMQEGLREQAQEELESLVQEHPDFGAGWNVLAELVAAGRDEARAASLRRRGHAAGRFRAADDPWRDELHASCFDPYRLEVLGATRMQSGELEAALAFLEKAVQLAPDDASVHDSLADAYTQLKRYDDARRTYEAGIAAAPADTRLPIHYAELLLNLGRKDDALAVVEAALKHTPESPDLHNQLGVALDALGRKDQAIAAYRRSLELHPVSPEVLMNLGKSLLLDNEDEGYATIAQVLAIRPNHIEAMLLLADREMSAGRLDAAGEYVETAHALAPESPQVRAVTAAWHLARGLAAARAGATADAIESFQAGIRADPTVAELHGNLGVVLAQNGRLQEALPAFEKLVVLDPHNATAHLYLGGALLSHQRNSDARRILERGLALAQAAGDIATQQSIREVLSRIR